MLYTLTLNPALDYVLGLDALHLGQIHRAASANVHFGGKGINVSLVLQELGVPSVATGFVAGFTGRALAEGLASDSITPDFVELGSGLTRINVKLRAEEETDVNAPGPAVSGDAMERLLTKLAALQAGDMLVLAGSLPAGVPRDVYGRIMARLAPGVEVAVDAEGEALLAALPYRPFLVKPNAEELGALFDTAVTTPEEALHYAARLQERGARHVLVSLGGDGAVLLDEQGNAHRVPAPAGQVVNTVGAGDSMVAGFLAGYCQSRDVAAALRLGVAAGSATAFSEGTATAAAIAALLE